LSCCGKQISEFKAVQEQQLAARASLTMRQSAAKVL
jgi:hypothetical protein